MMEQTMDEEKLKFLGRPENLDMNELMKEWQSKSHRVAEEEQVICSLVLTLEKMSLEAKERSLIALKDW